MRRLAVRTIFDQILLVAGGGTRPQVPPPLYNSKAKKELGMTFRSLEETIIDTVKSLLELEQVIGKAYFERFGEPQVAIDQILDIDIDESLLPFRKVSHDPFITLSFSPAGRKILPIVRQLERKGNYSRMPFAKPLAQLWRQVLP